MLKLVHVDGNVAKSILVIGLKLPQVCGYAENQTDVFKKQSETFENQSETFENQSETFENQSETYENQSETF